MQHLLEKALTETLAEADKVVPFEKTIFKKVSLEGVRPTNLAKFLVDKAIPHDAKFGASRDEGQFEDIEHMFLFWKESVLKGELEREEELGKVFNNIAWTFVYNKLTRQGYKRVGVRSSDMRTFDSVISAGGVYGLFKAGHYATLVEYYSLFFKDTNTGN